MDIIGNAVYLSTQLRADLSILSRELTEYETGLTIWISFLDEVAVSARWIEILIEQVLGEGGAELLTCHENAWGSAGRVFLVSMLASRSSG